MSVNPLRENEDLWNDWALDSTNLPIHISQAKSGRLGYYCMGCGAEMQAVKSNIQNRVSFFRHDPGDMRRRMTCEYGSETYRHKLGKEILQQTKKIMVPNLYKYPPKGYDGKKVKLAESCFINAERVEIELTFFHTDRGEVKYGRGNQIPIDERLHIIRPDVTFFNSKNEPILFIELVATHKVSNEKKIKLRSLGIDSVQVKLPPKDETALAACFLVTEYTKWIYNGLESSADYFQVSNGDGERISEIDKLQGKLFEESFGCRTAQIGKFIRTITRCLESEYYKSIERKLIAEIEVTEQAAEELEGELESRREELRKAIRFKYEEESSRLEQRERNLRARKEFFQMHLGDLEERYNRKVSDLRIEEESIRDEEEEFVLRTDESSPQNRKAQETLWRDLQTGRRTWQDERRKKLNIDGAEQLFREGIQNRVLREEEEFRQEERDFEKRHRAWVEEEEGAAERAIESVRREIQDFGSIAARKEDELEQRVRKNLERGNEKIRRGDFDQTGKLPSRNQGDLPAARVVSALIDAQEQHKRLREAKECFERKDWKSWPR